MPQSLSCVLVHVIFSTKNRRPFLAPPVRPELHRYIGGLLNEIQCPVLKVGGVEDHVHYMCGLSRTITIAKMIEEVKVGSSKWLKTKGGEFNDFHWQSGYGAFSVSQSLVQKVMHYIAIQEEHHMKESFQEEFRKFLSGYHVEYDERYVWD